MWLEETAVSGRHRRVMTRILMIALMLAFLNACSFSPMRSAPVVAGPGSTAFSAGYSNDYDGGYGPEHGDGNSLSWPWVVVGVGILAATFGTCFAIESADGKSMCFALVDAVLSD